MVSEPTQHCCAACLIMYCRRHLQDQVRGSSALKAFRSNYDRLAAAAAALQGAGQGAAASSKEADDGQEVTSAEPQGTREKEFAAALLKLLQESQRQDE